MKKMKKGNTQKCDKIKENRQIEILQKRINLYEKAKSASICVGILRNGRYIKNIDATDAK